MRRSILGDSRVVVLRRFVDARGHCAEIYNKDRFVEESGFDGQLVQDNMSHSRRGVLWGLHHQVEPRAQGKLVRVAAGAVFDVAVHIRRSSATFDDWFGIELSSMEGTQLWIPHGFFHGYLALTNTADVLYKTTDVYSPEHERSVRWDNLTIGIDWPMEHVGKVLLSDKDAEAPSFLDAVVVE